MRGGHLGITFAKVDAFWGALSAGCSSNRVGLPKRQGGDRVGDKGLGFSDLSAPFPVAFRILRDFCDPAETAFIGPS
jgi:hypothetical protein